MNNLSILPNDNIAGDPPAATPPPPTPPRPQYRQTYQNVKVLDFNMTFWNMVVFMIKWAFAAIPAMIIVMGIGMLIGMLSFMGLAALGLGLGAMTGGPTPSPTPVVRSR